MATPSPLGQKTMPGHNLDEQEKLGLQSIWWEYVCRLCGRWHAGGLSRRDGDSRDHLCPRVKMIVIEHGPGPHQGKQVIEFWPPSELVERPDDYTYDEVWTAGKFADVNQEHMAAQDRAREAAEKAAEDAEQVKAAKNRPRRA